MLGEWKAFDRNRSERTSIASAPSLRTNPTATRPYHRHLTRHIPTRINRALDVGCGTGTFTRVLADRATRVDAIDLARNDRGGAPELAGPVETSASRWPTCSKLLRIRPVRRDRDARDAAPRPLELALNRLVTALAPGGNAARARPSGRHGIQGASRNGIAWLALRLKRLAQWPSLGARGRRSARGTTTADAIGTIPGRRSSGRIAGCSPGPA